MEDGPAPISVSGARLCVSADWNMGTKLWQKVVKIVVHTLLVLANLWVWESGLGGCAARTKNRDQRGSLQEHIYFRTPYRPSEGVFSA
jgi:hypothetical protein